LPYPTKFPIIIVGELAAKNKAVAEPNYFSFHGCTSYNVK
jgi:hypothetical protein